MTLSTESSPTARQATRSVSIGGVTVGGDADIVLQSMTTADTMDIEATVAESLRMIDAGCQIVRITAPSKKEAEALGEIRARLDAAGHTGVPLVADIHFTPNAAEIAADHVEKIRVNPGNYADKKKFETHDYTPETYAAELERIRERFTPLVRKCKALGRAMRIGTNHGSLSDRILSHYGDTPLGMVESAMEFLNICRDEDYHDVVLSMKASNPQVMVQAYRMLADRMRASGMAYPLHLGVTEAGEGEDGRIKSAVGIGTLLAEGLGDTIRVSLTEPPRGRNSRRPHARRTGGSGQERSAAGPRRDSARWFRPIQLCPQTVKRGGTRWRWPGAGGLSRPGGTAPDGSGTLCHRAPIPSRLGQMGSGRCRLRPAACRRPHLRLCFTRLDQGCSACRSVAGCCSGGAPPPAVGMGRLPPCPF